MITNKIKSLLALKGYSFASFASHLGIARQSLNNKAKAEAYKATDLIELAELTGTTLAFVNDQGEIVMKFDKNDIAAKEKE